MGNQIHISRHGGHVSREKSQFDQLFTLTLQEPALVIGAKPNLYCEAIELVCGGSPKACVLVEWKALDRVKSEL